MKKLLFLFLYIPLIVYSQDETLVIRGNTGNLYITHTAVPKESFYSIGRLYNASPKEIPTYNNTTLEAGISIGQVLKIPLSNINFVQNSKAALDETTVPLYHIIEPKETLYQLSEKYNKVPIATLKIWNKISDENVAVGKKIIVGYLKVKTALSALAKQGAALVIVAPDKVKTEVVVPTKKAEPKVEIVKAIEEPKTYAPVSKPTPVFKNNEDEIFNPAKDYKGGIFKTDYNSEGNKENGVAGIFKSTSGWQDGKYYCLYNKAQQYTIVKITNKSNGKFVYAKVLDAMPDLKQNNNVQIRVSNAASEVLGSTTSNFDCTIEY